MRSSVPPNATYRRNRSGTCEGAPSSRRVHFRLGARTVAAGIPDPSEHFRGRPTTCAASRMHRRRKSLLGDPAIYRWAIQGGDSHHVANSEEGRCRIRRDRLTHRPTSAEDGSSKRGPPSGGNTSWLSRAAILQSSCSRRMPLAPIAVITRSGDTARNALSKRPKSALRREDRADPDRNSFRRRPN
jgi:hypothetical protein